MVLVPNAKGFIFNEDKGVVDPNFGVTISGSGGAKGEEKLNNFK